MTNETKITPTLSASTSQHLVTWARHVQGRNVVRTAALALGSEVDVMPLKGVLLGALGIVPPAERPIRDADVLVLNATMTRAVRRLGQRGFRIVDVPWSHGYVSLVPPTPSEPWLDLHTLLMPVGMGRLDARWLFARADANHTLFGARVFIPRPAALMVQLIANVIKDRIIDAFEHVPRDLARLADTLTPRELDVVAADLHALDLARGGARAVVWAGLRSGSPGLDALATRLLPNPRDRRRCEAAIADLERLGATSLRARVTARAGADSVLLQALATAFTALSVATHPLRKAWLLANNQGDGPTDMR